MTHLASSAFSIADSRAAVQPRTHQRPGLMLLLMFATLLGACGAGEPVAGYQVTTQAVPPSPTKALPPMDLPRDEAPHPSLTEWWYYTGHLYSGERRYGFEMVVFQAVRGDLPRAYVSHFAVTDVQDKSFSYDEKVYSGPQPQPPEGFDLRVGGWRMQGLNGQDQLHASMPGYSIDLDLSAVKPVVLHDGDGIVSFGPVGVSYYYSHTRMEVTGVLEDHGEQLPVTGLAWMDHQWGDFISVAGGGWDWYSVQMEDGSDLTVSIVRDLEGREMLRYGTYVGADGEAQHLSAEQLEASSSGEWTSPKTGTTYPTSHTLTIPSRKLTLRLEAVLKNQELDTRESTGLAYWEGAVRTTGTSDGKPVRGEGYVELTGYGEYSP